MNDQWKPVLDKLEKLRQRAVEIKTDNDILSAIEKIEMPESLRELIRSVPISTGTVNSPAAGLTVNLAERTITRIIKTIQDYKGE
ncbi:MAG: hypothetical protein WC643_01410 [Parcubacteria group bacterium]|jgi:hypothetical protein